MNKAMLTIGIILLSIIALGIFNVVQNYTTGNELDYYLLKETTEASMTDAVDLAYYREKGIVRMDKEKFTESFLLRFNDTVDTNRNYDIRFYDMHEVPPKVTIKINSGTSSTYKGENLAIQTDLTAIVETNNKTDPVSYKLLSGTMAN